MKELNTYLIFNGNCGEAMQFYAKCLGAELQLMKFGDMPEACPEGAPEGPKTGSYARLTKGKAVLNGVRQRTGHVFYARQQFLHQY
jgi:PhnB protein